MEIRPYLPSDYPMILSWWKASGEHPPLITMVPTESSWVLLIDNVPALVVSLILTNLSEIAWIEGFVGNPALKGPERRNGAIYLIKYIEDQAKRLGYKRLVCLGIRDKVIERYKELGYTETCKNVTTFAKVL